MALPLKPDWVPTAHACDSRLKLFSATLFFVKKQTCAFVQCRHDPAMDDITWKFSRCSASKTWLSTRTVS